LREEIIPLSGIENMRPLLRTERRRRVFIVDGFQCIANDLRRNKKM
jgi:hypothetical protein